MNSPTSVEAAGLVTAGDVIVDTQRSGLSGAARLAATALAAIIFGTATIIMLGIAIVAVFAA